MKSASGRQTPPPGYELTCVEPGRKGYAAVIRVGSTTPTDSASRCRAKPIFPQTHGCLASGLSHGRIWRAGIRLCGTAEHPAALSDVTTSSIHARRPTSGRPTSAGAYSMSLPDKAAEGSIFGQEAVRAVASRGQTPQGRAWETGFSIRSCSRAQRRCGPSEACYYRSSLTAPFTFVMHLAQTMLQSFSLLTIGRGVSQPFVELAFLVPKVLTMLPPLAIAFPPLRGRRGGLGHSGYRYRNRNLNVGLPWGRRLCIDHRREGACEQKRGEHGKAGLHGGSYPVSNDQ